MAGGGHKILDLVIEVRILMRAHFMKDLKNLQNKVPEQVSHVTKTLEKGGFEAYFVGGCVRDLAMAQIFNETEVDRQPKDWDVATNAKPEQIMALFEKTVYENDFGTVGVCVPVWEDVNRETPEYEIVEVTPYRIEAKYSDFRHPDEVKFSDKLEDDLKRRDFTINALALDSNGHLIDLFDGLKDIKDKTIERLGTQIIDLLKTLSECCEQCVFLASLAFLFLMKPRKAS